MEMINWTVRIKNKWFWMTIIPLILLLIEQILGIFGVQLDLSGLQAQILAVVETVFLILGALGLVVDMTTEGIGDSDRALDYKVPYPKKQDK